MITRRTFIVSGASLLATPAIAKHTVTSVTRSFRNHSWREHFNNLNKGAILCDLDSRALFFWGPQGKVSKIYPTSVPRSPEMSRTGVTSVIEKRVGPTWRPTPSMRQRDPSLPAVVGPGPDNPLGSHAMYLTWQYYRIHGTHDRRKIGRQSSSGCVGLYNEHIEELFSLTPIGIPVKIIGQNKAH